MEQWERWMTAKRGEGTLGTPCCMGFYTLPAYIHCPILYYTILMPSVRKTLGVRPKLLQQEQLLAQFLVTTKYEKHCKGQLTKWSNHDNMALTLADKRSLPSVLVYSLLHLNHR